MSVNDKVLLMQDSQDMILHHNFIQQLPKLIKDKIIEPVEDKKVPGKLLDNDLGFKNTRAKNNKKN
jgi:hypothetical protein